MSSREISYYESPEARARREQAESRAWTFVSQTSSFFSTDVNSDALADLSMADLEAFTDYLGDLSRESGKGYPEGTVKQLEYNYKTARNVYVARRNDWFDCAERGDLGWLEHQEARNRHLVCRNYFQSGKNKSETVDGQPFLGCDKDQIQAVINRCNYEIPRYREGDSRLRRWNALLSAANYAERREQRKAVVLREEARAQAEEQRYREQQAGGSSRA